MSKKIIIVGIIVLLAVIGAGVVFAIGRRSANTAQVSGTTAEVPSGDSQQHVLDSGEAPPLGSKGAGSGGGSGGGQWGGRSQASVVWQLGADGWEAVSTPSTCPTLLVLQTPVDMTNVTAILYPGQTRGGNYKPHGGFRFDKATTNTVAVSAPMDAYVVEGSRYLVEGETQYMFDFIAPCGIMYRLGHLLKLTPTFQAIADTFPAATEGDSRTTMVSPQVSVKARDAVATAIGVTKGTNVFVDFGVYDLRTKNEASKDAAWAANPVHDPELAQHAVCWFDLLPAPDAAKVKSLPAGDPASGKTSDFCHE